MVYVISKEGQPLMPTERHGKVKHLLRQGRAKVVRSAPFTIQLQYETGSHTQEVTLGIDSGYTYIGISAMSDNKELLSCEVELLDGMKERIYDRAMYRRNRRQRLRHRAPRFDNRGRAQGWFPPSVRHKSDSHIRLAYMLKGLLPITYPIAEVANFDIQRINNPDIQGKEYQQGEQMGWQNVREYIFHRDGHKCQKPECKSKGEKVLCEHHIIPRAQGGTDAPDNLVTLCNQCHTSENHKGFLKDWKPKVNGFKAETFMTTVRHTICEQLKGIFPNVGITYGYITKHRRIGQKLAKTHANDGYIIAGGKGQPRAETLSIRQIRRNNRSLERFYDAKYIDTRTGKPEYASVLNNGRTTRNMNLNGENLKKYRGEKVGKGRRSIRRNHYFYQPNDLVKYEGKIYEVKGVVNRGNYVALKGIKKQPKVEQLKPYRFRKGFVIENRKGKRNQGGAIHPTA